MVAFQLFFDFGYYIGKSGREEIVGTFGMVDRTINPLYCSKLARGGKKEDLTLLKSSVS